MIVSLVLLLGAGGVLIGFLLAVLGAGGSILLMPLLISGAALSVREAVPLSLLVVTLMALGNLGPYLRRGQVAAKPALILGLPALAGSWIGGSFVKAGHLSEPVQLGVFTIAALLAAWLLTRPVSIHKPVVKLGGLFLGGQGVLIGLLTGIAGVGGGFAIVPALVLLAGLPMQLASGTSLLLIALNSLVAMAALGSWPAAGLPLLFPPVDRGLHGCPDRPAAGTKTSRPPAAAGLCGAAGGIGPAHRRGIVPPPLRPCQSGRSAGRRPRSARTAKG